MKTTAITALVLALTACVEPNPEFDPGSPPPQPDGSVGVMTDGLAPDYGLVRGQDMDPSSDADLGPDPGPTPDATVPCGPATCSGCCNVFGKCLDGTTDKACGGGGLGCAWCGDGYACENQQCVPVPPTTYQVLLLSASLNGGAWPVCFENTCDLYLEISFGNTKATSSTITDQNNPIWNPPELMFEALEQELVSTPVIATLRDDDYGPDQIVGICDFTFDPSGLSTGAFTVPCYAGSGSGSQPTATVTLLLL